MTNKTADSFKMEEKTLEIILGDTLSRRHWLAGRLKRTLDESGQLDEIKGI